MKAWRTALGCVFGIVAAATAAASEVPRVFIAGDSTASAYGPERAPREGWGMALQSWFGAHREVRNHAISGRSSRSYIEQGALDAFVGEIRRGDVLLIQFGHNDEKVEDPARHTEPVEEFPRWLMRYVDAARSRGATPILLTPVARRVFDGNQLLDTHARYADAVRTLARREGVLLVDLAASSMNWLRALGPEVSKRFYMHVPAQGLVDDTHLNGHGAALVACLVVAGWKAADPALARDLVRDTACGAPSDARARLAAQPNPSIVVAGDADARTQPGPHGGAGTTVAHPYFADAPGFDFAVRKRVLKPGAGIGLHLHEHDEVYTVLAGRGSYILDGTVRAVGPGDVMLTRQGSTHAIRQDGDDDLVLLIVYAKKPTP